MRKTSKLIIGIILILTMLIVFIPKAYAYDPTLQDITTTFNGCAVVKNYNLDSETMNLHASYSAGDEEHLPTITITVTNAGVYNLVYELNSNILTGKYNGGASDVREIWPVVSNILIDCIQQYHDHAEGDMYETLNSSQISNYTLENEGLKINNSSANMYLMQTNITMRIPTLDFNSYIKVEDLADVKDNLAGDGVVDQFQKGKVLFRKRTINDKDILIIGEQDDFTFRINKSIPSILTAMLNSDEAVAYFNDNYPAVSGNKVFDGFKIEINPIKNNDEEILFNNGNYKFVRITIDREAIKTALEEKKRKNDGGGSEPGTPVIGDPGTGGGGGSLPNTGGTFNLVLYGLFVIVFFGGIGLISLTSNPKKKQK